jgi:hypothetical protein
MSDKPAAVHPSEPVRGPMEASAAETAGRLRGGVALGLAEAALLWLRAAAVLILLAPFLLLLLLLL